MIEGVIRAFSTVVRSIVVVVVIVVMRTQDGGELKALHRDAFSLAVKMPVFHITVPKLDCEAPAPDSSFLSTQTMGGRSS